MQSIVLQPFRILLFSVKRGSMIRTDKGPKSVMNPKLAHSIGRSCIVTESWGFK